VSSVQAEIDEKLLAEIRKLADEQGRSERELLDEAVRRYLERSDPRRFEELLKKMSSRFDLDEAERIAYEELHAMRRERKAAQ
jgi:Arc/MetJ family transcription regulator